MLLGVIDPWALDNRIRRAYAERDRARVKLRQAEADFDWAPDAALLHAELAHELREKLGTEPIAAPALNAVNGLREQALLFEFDKRVWDAYARTPRAVEGPERGRFTLQQILKQALRDAERQAAWLTTFTAETSALVEAQKRRWDARAEWRAENPLLAPALASELAENKPWQAFNAASQELFQALHIADLNQLIQQGLARDARANWPARLTLRHLVELLAEGGWFRAVTPQPEPFPEAYAAASFLRGFELLGNAWVNALKPTAQFFVFDAARRPAHAARFGKIWGLLPLNPAFLRRKLDLSGERLKAEQRSLARALLVEARSLAFRAQVGSVADCSFAAALSEFSEAAPVAFGFELNPRLFGALFRADATHPAQFGALLLAAFHSERLVQTYDEDWFRNPRAMPDLRAWAEQLLPAPELDLKSALVQGQTALLRMLSVAV